MGFGMPGIIVYRAVIQPGIGILCLGFSDRAIFCQLPANIITKINCCRCWINPSSRNYFRVMER